MRIPRQHDEITLDWLNEVMRQSGVVTDGNAIERYSVEPLGEDLGYLSFLYRVRPQYSKAGLELPGTFVVKFPSTESASRATGNSLRAFEREALFYKHCAHESPCAPPMHYYSYTDPQADAHVLVMEDLDGCRFVNQVDGVSPEDALRCIRAMAEHHALYWNKTDEMTWAPPFSDFGALYQPMLHTGASQILENWGDVLAPTYLDHVDRALPAYANVAHALQKLPTTLVHCDPRIENIAFDGDRPRFYDWQLASRGPAAYDLMYFFKQSMDVDVRHECQDDLFDAYLAALAERGIDYPRERLLDDIGLASCTIWGFIAMVGNFFYRNEVNERIWNITQPRFMGMIEDFGGIHKLDQFV
jgi:thiamine kinase-like enzyme